MNAAQLPAQDGALLRRATVLLDTVGRGAPPDQNAIALACLAAAESVSIWAPGTQPFVSNLSAGDVRAAVEEALGLLASLSPATFRLHDVADAVDAVQRAFALSSR